VNAMVTNPTFDSQVMHSNAICTSLLSTLPLFHCSHAFLCKLYSQVCLRKRTQIQTHAYTLTHIHAVTFTLTRIRTHKHTYNRSNI
jgi:hypothetical protein